MFGEHGENLARILRKFKSALITFKPKKVIPPARTPDLDESADPLQIPGNEIRKQAASAQRGYERGMAEFIEFLSGIASDHVAGWAPPLKRIRLFLAQAMTGPGQRMASEAGGKK